MKEYLKPIVLENEDLAEGVYAASGDCYTVTARIVQSPSLGQDNYIIQFDAAHAASDAHHSGELRIRVNFNQNVTFVSATEMAYMSGNGTSAITLSDGAHHANAYENIGLGNLTVSAGADLAVTGVTCIYCNRDCNQGHTW